MRELSSGSYDTLIASFFSRHIIVVINTQLSTLTIYILCASLLSVLLTNISAYAGVFSVTFLISCAAIPSLRICLAESQTTSRQDDAFSKLSVIACAICILCTFQCSA